MSGNAAPLAAAPSLVVVDTPSDPGHIAEGTVGDTVAAHTEIGHTAVGTAVAVEDTAPAACSLFAALVFQRVQFGYHSWHRNAPLGRSGVHNWCRNY